ncbi:MAG: hypothetical protein Q8K74_13375 [Candidatus Nitrotoga sp.]|nr:hypothetical protein [Candidatus Nitrotoga sp.]MDP1857003.1 hypothetical protein [Candidatus Nitrotoga sp.]
MATKSKKADKPDKPDKPESEPLARKSVQLSVRKDQTPTEKAREYVRLVVSPELAAYRVICTADSNGGNSAIWEGLDVPSLAEELRAQSATVNRGELDHVEAMLMNQATGLQSLYARLTERAMGQDHMPNFEGFMRMALRAQSQCRATLETLAAIKNPPVIFAKQANINQGNGNQQVNNGTLASHAGKNINQQNELLEEQHGSETVDTRATGKAIRKDKAMATVG